MTDQTIPIFGQNGNVLKPTSPSEIPVENMLAWTLDPKAEGDLDSDYIVGVLLYETTRIKERLIKTMSELKETKLEVEALKTKLNQ